MARFCCGRGGRSGGGRTKAGTRYVPGTVAVSINVSTCGPCAPSAACDDRSISRLSWRGWESMPPDAPAPRACRATAAPRVARVDPSAETPCLPPSCRPTARSRRRACRSRPPKVRRFARCDLRPLAEKRTFAPSSAGPAAAIAPRVRFASIATCFASAATCRLSAAMSRRCCADAFLVVVTWPRTSLRESRAISCFSTAPMFGMVNLASVDDCSDIQPRNAIRTGIEHLHKRRLPV